MRLRSCVSATLADTMPYTTHVILGRGPACAALISMIFESVRLFCCRIRTMNADSQGYAVAEAFIQVGSSDGDGSAKQLDPAIKLAEKEIDRKAERVLKGMVLMVGIAVVVAVVAGVALLVAGRAQASGQAAAGKALMPLGCSPSGV